VITSHANLAKTACRKILEGCRGNHRCTYCFGRHAPISQILLLAAEIRRTTPIKNIITASFGVIQRLFVSTQPSGKVYGSGEVKQRFSQRFYLLGWELPNSLFMSRRDRANAPRDLL
jgi:hypothetical protein